MIPVYAFGELLIDFLEYDFETEDGIKIPCFKQYPGGAPANAAVAASKLGSDVYFLGQVGHDIFGDFLIDCIKHYGIDTRYLKQTSKGHTPLAFVSLDDEGERSFEFLRKNTADILLQPEDLPDVSKCKKGIWHFCSNTLTDEQIRRTHFSLAEALSANKQWISFDVNLRTNLWSKEQQFIDPILKMLPLAHVVKVSKEELEHLYSHDAVSKLTELCFAGQTLAIFITDGANPITVIQPHEMTEVIAPSVNVVDTTAGGDAFSGGLLNYIACSDLSAIDWHKAAEFAAKCGAIAVSKAGAFTSLPTKSVVDNFR